jgi:aminopeptidase N
LNWIKSYTTASLSEDRTPGTNAIRQDLDNLRNAGLIYGNIIYTKAPVMMSKLVEIIGEEAYREGIREYLQTFAYGNATWDDLIAILDAKSPENLAEFSDVWVNQKGMPHISFSVEGKELKITQVDPLGRSLIWPQRFDMTFIGETETSIEVNLTQAESTHLIPDGTKVILPNTDGRGYGLFIPDGRSMEWLLSHWQEIKDDTARQSLLVTIHENYQDRRISAQDWLTALLNGLNKEKNTLIASSICRYLHEPLLEAGTDQTEETIWKAAQSHSINSCRIQLMRCLIARAKSPKSVKKLYQIWSKQSHPMLNIRDYMSLAYVLSLHMPQKYEEIISTQRARISNPDRIREFDFISKAVTPDTLEMDKVFESLLKAENRRIEPWAEDALAYLNHPLRGEYSVKYIRPGLEIMKEVQRTGDIFFPKYWAMSLLGSHRSEAAKKEVDAFFEAHPDYPQLLKNKILQASPR